MPDEISAADFNSMMAKRKPTKYGNTRVLVDGEAFDSQAEYTRWWDLQQMQREGIISDLERQVRIPLSAHGVQLGAYVADFRYRDESGAVVIEDVKSPLSRTPIYQWKKKHVLAQYGITITELESG
ncbi:MAG: DUF1064 domain-containing protein [Thermomicrobiales bacterium]